MSWSCGTAFSRLGTASSMARLLDLFCGLGGAAKGYARAGFDVVGVDSASQPDFPYYFSCADAVEFLRGTDVARSFDVIHASPPCAAYTSIGKQNATRGVGGDHPRLYEVIRDELDRIGLPYVIENPAARPDVVLCGEMYRLGVLRHRRFELGGWQMEQPKHRAHRGKVRGWRHGVWQDGPYVALYGAGGGKASLEEGRVAMGIEWATDLKQLVQAIPPAYTQAIGAAFLR
jgi:hypothetical protein